MSSWLEDVPNNLPGRQRRAVLFGVVCTCLTWLCLVLLAVLLWHVCQQGARYLNWSFLGSFDSRHPQEAGIYAALWGTVWLILMTALIAIPVGVGAALYLEEYARPSRLSRFIELNLNNLAGVPSIIYGMLGLAVFVRWFGLGRSLWAGSITMSLLVLPVVILASREAVRAVPQSIRRAAFALGASRWQTIWHHVLPASLPGILTGVILALSRAMGETAPLIILGVPTFARFVPQGPADQFTVMPMQIYAWASEFKKEFHDVAAAGIVVLLVVLLAMNAIAVFLRIRSQKKLGV